ncbi:hypothetical protein [Aridibaculum aurantiacum]|uniref:hypothetical protein n=1 Tax=Aridibaculum aurantiacum TaxID=2810307 RepID=UPI001A95D03A|nr:hypothetical protein [Aridibaculum aurantiacum]
MTKLKMVLLLIIYCCSAALVFAQVKPPSISQMGTPEDTISKNRKEMLEYTSRIEENKVNRDTTYLQIGGALRFNYINTNYEQGRSPLGTSLRNDFTLDTWRLNVNAESKGILMSFEYRFYPTFNTHFIQHGWFGYNLTNHTQVQLGVSQVPFGNLKYASHSWWFQTPYYVGLEDDYDMGIKIRHTSDRWEGALAYYLLAEPRGTSDPTYGPYSAARYSYDVVPVPGNNNVERNQFNARGAYNFSGTKVGASLQYGQIFNLVNNNVGHQTASAIHLEGNYGRFNLKAQYLHYNYNNVRNDAGELLNVVQMGAYGFGTYDVAANASMYVAGLSYSLPLNFGPVSDITFYNDYTYTRKNGQGQHNSGTYSFANTQQNVIGALVSAGKIYTYIDWAAGKNHPWLTEYFGGSALGAGIGIDPSKPVSSTNLPNQNSRWNSRFNINIGYYF